MPNFIKFLGTAGARFVVARQIRSSAGTWIELDGSHFLLDPGPGTLLKCSSSKPKLAPNLLDAIFLSHLHLDHSCDVNVIIEAMTDGGTKKKGIVFAPEQAVNSEDKVIFNYLHSFVERFEFFDNLKRFKIGNVSFESISHKHGVETYGLKFFSTSGVISFITDTKFFDELIELYKDSDLIIINVVRNKPTDVSDVKHLCMDDALKIISSIKPKACILTHFGMTMIASKPWLLADSLQQKTGVKVIAANDGMVFNL